MSSCICNNTIHLEIFSEKVYKIPVVDFRQLWTTCNDSIKLAYLLQAQSSVSGSNALALGMTQWIQHTVVRVNRWQAVLIKLILYDVNQLLHTTVVVRPITDDLKQRSQSGSEKLPPMTYRTVDSYQHTKVLFVKLSYNEKVPSRACLDQHLIAIRSPVIHGDHVQSTTSLIVITPSLG